MALTEMPASLPVTVYHPVFGPKIVSDFNELRGLNSDWFSTAELADKARTWTEAKVVMHHNQSVKVAEMLGHEPPAATEGGEKVVRNRVAALESLDAGNAEPL